MGWNQRQERPCVVEEGRARDQVRAGDPSPTGNKFQRSVSPKPGTDGAKKGLVAVYSGKLPPSHTGNLPPTGDGICRHTPGEESPLMQNVTSACLHHRRHSRAGITFKSDWKR